MWLVLKLGKFYTLCYKDSVFVIHEILISSRIINSILMEMYLNLNILPYIAFRCFDTQDHISLKILETYDD